MALEPIYRSVAYLALGIFKLRDVKVTVLGENNVPAQGGAVVVSNHSGYLDFMFAEYPFLKFNRFLRFMAKKEIFEKPVAGWVMRKLRHIPVDRIDGEKSYCMAVDLLKEGELVGIFPEATISRSFEIKSIRNGAIRMAAEAGVPVMNVMIFGSQRVWTKGKKNNLTSKHLPVYIYVGRPWYPTASSPEVLEQETENLRSTMQHDLSLLWDQYQKDLGAFPKGAFWVPKRFGGSAPSYEEAEAQDKVVDAERHRVRRLNKELDELTKGLKDFCVKVGQQGKDIALRIAPKTTGEADAATAAATAADGGSDGAVTAASHSNNVAELQESLRKVVREVQHNASDGLTEGLDRIKAASERLRVGVAELPDIRETSTYQTFEDSLVALVSKARQIGDALPVRVRSHVKAMPTALFLAQDGVLDCDLPEDTLTRLQEFPGKLYAVCDFAIPHPLKNATIVTHAEAGELVDENSVVFGSSLGDNELMEAAGLGVAVGDAAWPTLKVADWVTAPAADNGIADVLARIEAALDEVES